MKISIPEPVKEVANGLGKAGYEAYLVGGCLRDLLIGREPKDWDIATDARPEDIQEIFPENVYENEFGTVGVKTGSEEPKLKIVEVTTFRIEGSYTDKRHPDTVKFATKVEEDLARRDFTVNAMALTLKGGEAGELVDPYKGKEDLKSRTIRTVGEPGERFGEDALRLMRAVRLAVELGFDIEMATRRAIEKESGLLEAISKERIRDEFVKTIMAPEAAKGVLLLEELNLLIHVLPELREGIGVSQNLHHIYSVFEHSVKALEYAAKNDFPLEVRLAALLHDAGKPRTKGGEGPNATFYNHEVVGARLAAAALDRLRFPKNTIEKVVHLIRYHMFYYNVGEVSEAGVRRFLVRVGPEYVDDLLKLREADRIGSGVPKAFPYKLRHLLYMIDKVKRDPISPKMLVLKGNDIMEIAKIPPGPKVGWILTVLLEEVITEPKWNEKGRLAERVKELAAMPDEKLRELAEKAEFTKEEFEAGLEEDIKKKFKVQ